MLRIAAVLLLSIAGFAAEFPPPVEHTFTIRDFKFHDGETLPELTLHYSTIGQARSNNAVLIMHGTGGTGSGFTSAQFGGELFGEGQPLDAAKYFIIMRSVTGNRPSQATACGRTFRSIAITTWSPRITG
jgi:homoserine O-acetyltransferase